MSAVSMIDNTPISFIIWGKYPDLYKHDLQVIGDPCAKLSWNSVMRHQYCETEGVENHVSDELFLPPFNQRLWLIWHSTCKTKCMERSLYRLNILNEVPTLCVRYIRLITHVRWCVVFIETPHFYKQHIDPSMCVSHIARRLDGSI